MKLNLLKVNWNQLKINWNQLKVNWNQLKPMDHISFRARHLNTITLKWIQKLFEGGKKERRVLGFICWYVGCYVFMLGINILSLSSMYFVRVFWGEFNPNFHYGCCYVFLITGLIITYIEYPYLPWLAPASGTSSLTMFRPDTQCDGDGVDFFSETVSKSWHW
jgi:hypothetical protein